MSLIGILPDWNSSLVRLFFRGYALSEEFRPFILANDRASRHVRAERKALAPKGLHYNTLLLFDSPKEMSEAHRQMQAYDWINPAVQYMIMSGQRLYSGMGFTDLRRMQMDASSGVMVRSSDGIVHELSPDSRNLVSDISDLVRDDDPDVIEVFDVESTFQRLFAASEKLREPLLIGRGETRAIYRPRKDVPVFDQRVHRARVSVPGREVTEGFIEAYKIDTEMHLFRDMRPGTIYSALGIEGEPLERLERLSALLNPASFMLTQMFPLPLESIIRMGTASLINYGMISEYLSTGSSIPGKSQYTPTVGGRVELFHRGFFPEVYKIDVQSMYPSIMLSEGIHPSSDYKEVFSSMLRRTLELRLGLKRMRDTKPRGSWEYQAYDIMQQRFKTIANTFYGYMFAPYFPFNDSRQASALTARGRELITIMEMSLREHHQVPISLDTDGIYFSSPAGAMQEPAREDSPLDALPGMVQQALQERLPPHIRLELEGPWKGLFLENKHCILLPEGSPDDIVLKGVGLTGRNQPKFLVDFLEKGAQYFLEGKTTELWDMYTDVQRRIESRLLGADDVVVTTECSYSPWYYREHMKKMPHMEVLARTGGRAGDYVSYFIAAGRGPKYALAMPARDFSPEKINAGYYSMILRRAAEKVFGRHEQPRLFG